MATKEGETQKPQQRAIPDNSYPMYLPRMGHCIIINNVASSMPASQKDVLELQMAYKQVGFEVYSYKDCTVEEMRRINAWVLSKESHQYSNCLAYNILCQRSRKNKLLDVNGRKAFTIRQLIDWLHSVETLSDKPKLVVVQTYDTVDTTRGKKTILPKKNNFFIAYSSIQEHSLSSEHSGGSLYLESLAEHIQNEYMNKSVDKIFAMVDESIKYKTGLPDKILMEIAAKISSDKMEAVAVGYLDIEGPVVKRLSHSRREDKLMFNYDVLEMWRNKSVKNTREKLAELLLEAANEGSYVNSKEVVTVLQSYAGSLEHHSVNSLTRILHFANFHRKTAIITTSESSEQYEKEIKMLKEEIEKLKETEQEAKKKMLAKIETMTAAKERLEREKEEERERKKELEKQLQKHEENLHKLKVEMERNQNLLLDKEKQLYQENYEREIQKMRHETELKQQTAIDEQKAAHNEEIQKLKEEKEKAKAAELQKTKELEEAVQLSQKQIEDLAAEKARYLKEAKEREQEAKKRQIERLREAELERIKRLEDETKQSAERLQSLSIEEIEDQNVDDDGASTETSIADYREDEHTKLLSEQIRNLKMKAEEAVEKDRALSRYKQQVQQIQKEKEEAEKQKLAESERLKKVEEELAKLTTEKVKHEIEMKLKEEKEHEKEILKQADLQKIRKLEEEMKLSAEEFAAEKERYERELQKMKEDKKMEYEIVQNERMRKVEDELKVKYETDLKEELQKREEEFEQIKQAQIERLRALEGENNKLKENLTPAAEDALVVPEPAPSETGSSPTKVATISPVAQTNVSVSDHSAQAEGRVKMTRISTHNTYLKLWTSVTVMAETGQVVVYSKTGPDNPSCIIIYNGEEGDEWTGNQIESPCKHNRVAVLGVEVEEQKLLALSCFKCQDIKLLDLRTQQVTTVYSGAKVCKMCHGDTNRLYVGSVDDSVIELDCTGFKFTRVQTINTEIGVVYQGLCYVPSPHRYIVVGGGNIIRAMSCDNGEIIWTVVGEIAGEEIDPYGLWFSHQHNRVLVCDGENSRILVLDPSTGSCVQTINMRDMGAIYYIDFCKEQMIVRHRPHKQGVIFSYFSVKQRSST